MGDVVKKYGHIKFFAVGDGLASNDHALAGDLLGRNFIILLDGQQKVDLQFGHRFDVSIDSAIRAGAADIDRFRDDVAVFLGDLDRHIMRNSWGGSSFLFGGSHHLPLIIGVGLGRLLCLLDLFSSCSGKPLC